MDINMRDFKDYEDMAMLELTESERESLEGRYNAITGGFTALDDYDTSGIEALVTVLDINNVLREDIPEKLIPREELLKNAPEQHDGYFQVPATIE